MCLEFRSRAVRIGGSRGQGRQALRAARLRRVARVGEDTTSSNVSADRSSMRAQSSRPVLSWSFCLRSALLKARASAPTPSSAVLRSRHSPVCRLATSLGVPVLVTSGRSDPSRAGVSSHTYIDTINHDDRGDLGCAEFGLLPPASTPHTAMSVCLPCGTRPTPSDRRLGVRDKGTRLGRSSLSDDFPGTECARVGPLWRS